MISLDSYLDGITTVAISGHIRPDGDCVGSCLAVYNYICDNYPTIMADSVSGTDSGEISVFEKCRQNPSHEVDGWKKRV